MYWDLFQSRFILLSLNPIYEIGAQWYFVYTVPVVHSPPSLDSKYLCLARIGHYVLVLNRKPEQ